MLENIPLSLFLVYVENIPSFFSYFVQYVEDGQSIFLPFFPKINVLGFLPNAEQFTKFTFGHLFDIIIVVNLIILFETIIYHYYIKRKVNNKKIQKLIGFQLCLADYIDSPSLITYPDFDNFGSGEDIIQISFDSPMHDYFTNKNRRNDNNNLIKNEIEILNNFDLQAIPQLKKQNEIGLSFSNFKRRLLENISISYAMPSDSLVNYNHTNPCIEIREVG